VHPNQGQSATLNIHTKYSWLAFMLAMFKPVATINGHQVQLQWGDNPIPLQPGVYDIQVHTKYLWDIGKARIQVDNRHGGPVSVYYAAPTLMFVGGAIDHQPVKPPHEALSIGILVGLPVLFVLLCCCMGSLSSMSGS
jgi:hypothetical protein